MRKIKLKSGRFLLLDDSDYETLSKYKWYDSNRGYVERHEFRGTKKKTIRIHREILGFPEKLYIDHADGNKLNNQRKNLRICKSSFNVFNSKLFKNNKTGLRGVFFETDVRYTKTPWKAYIGKRNIGRFKTKFEAAKAYNGAVVKIAGEFARPNSLYGLKKSGRG